MACRGMAGSGKARSVLARKGEAVLGSVRFGLLVRGMVGQGTAIRDVVRPGVGPLRSGAVG